MPEVAKTQESGVHRAMKVSVTAYRKRVLDRRWDLEITIATGEKGRGQKRSLLLTAHEARKLAYGILIELDRAADEVLERLRTKDDSAP